MRHLFIYLQVKPRVGIATGFGSGFLGLLHRLLTDDTYLKLVSGVGVWVGAILAIMTLIARIARAFKKYFRKPLIK